MCQSRTLNDVENKQASKPQKNKTVQCASVVWVENTLLMREVKVDCPAWFKLTGMITQIPALHDGCFSTSILTRYLQVRSFRCQARLLLSIWGTRNAAVQRVCRGMPLKRYRLGHEHTIVGDLRKSGIHAYASLEMHPSLLLDGIGRILDMRNNHDMASLKYSLQRILPGLACCFPALQLYRVAV